MSRGFKFALCIPAVMVIVFLIYWPWSPGGRQTINMRIARKHLPQVQAILDQDARFAKVTIGEYTGQDGALGLWGDVTTDAALSDLMKLVAQEKLPVPVFWGITVRPEP